MHVDRFGNLVTDIPTALLTTVDYLVIDVGDTRIEGLSSSYAEADGLLAIIGSFDTLEIALKNGNAAFKLSRGTGAAVTVRRSP